MAASIPSMRRAILTACTAPVLLLSLAACGSSTVKGSLLLGGSEFEDFSTSGTKCWGTGGYEDVEEGAQVIVRNNKGETVGLGALRAGKWDAEYKHVCTFAFSVPDVEGADSYTVEIARRGEVAFTEKEASEVVITLGAD